MNASQEQEIGIRQVNNAMAQLADVTNKNTADAEELSTGSEELASQAEQLKESMSFFTMDQNNKSRHIAKKSKTKTLKTSNLKKKSRDKKVSNIPLDEEFENF
jgi:methyl-accepting chemotaxis protein